MQKATNDANVRAKIVAMMRIGSIVAALPFVFYIPVITAVGSKTGNLGQAATGITILFTAIFSCISFAGLILLKEPYRKKENEEEETKISGKDLIQLAKIDKPLWIHCIALLVAGLTGTGGATVIYLKWKYCCDIATGAVDLAKFTQVSTIISLINMVVSFSCPFLLKSFLKFFKSPDRCLRSCYLMQGIVLAAIGILDLIGLLYLPVLYLLHVLLMIPNGIAVMMWGIVTMECADYAEYHTGRNTTALVNSMYNIFSKTSSIIGTASSNLVLIIVGYSVNAVTGAYAGDLSTLPSLINGLKLFVAWLPMVCVLLGWFIMKKFYGISDESRQEMTEELTRKHAEEAARAEAIS